MTMISWVEMKKLLLEGNEHRSYQDDSHYHIFAQVAGLVFKTSLSINSKSETFNVREAKDLIEKLNYDEPPFSVKEEKQPISLPVVSRRFIYSTSVVQFSAASSATDIFTISGSSRRVIKVRKISITLSGSLTLGGTITVETSLIKRLSRNTGGTSNYLVAVPHDSRAEDAAATVVYYTSNPTLGVAAGVVRSRKITVPSANTGNQILPIEWVFDEPIVLVGHDESLSVNLNSNTIPSDSNAIDIEWEEILG